MKCKQQQPARLQHSSHFTKYRKQRFFGKVNDGIKCRDPSKCSIGKVQRHHVSFPEGNVWIELPGLLQHSRRKIQTENGCASIAQVAGDVAGAAAHVTYVATSYDRGSE